MSKRTFAILCVALLSCTTAFAQHPEHGSFRATVVVEVLDSQGIAVFADTNHDGSIDQRFFLQHEDGMAVDAAMPHRLVAANVEYRPGYARIVAGRDVIELTVSDVPPPAWNPKGFRVWRQDGYGLSHSVGETSIAMPASDAPRPGTISTNFCDASTSCYPGDTDGGGGGGGGGGAGTVTCDSGGPGSTSCSTTDGTASCSTSCGTGYYACCNNPSATNRTASCKCIRG
jgi:hypothetical protein